jgi:hypothetical protein
MEVVFSARRNLEIKNYNLVAKEKILVAIDTCDYKSCNHSGQVTKGNELQKKLYMACTITLVVTYHFRL